MVLMKGSALFLCAARGQTTEVVVWMMVYAGLLLQ